MCVWYDVIKTILTESGSHLSSSSIKKFSNCLVIIVKGEEGLFSDGLDLWKRVFSTINQGGFTHYTKIKKPDFWKTWFITNYSYWVHPKFRIPIWQILPINKWRNRANGRWFTSLFSVRMQRVDWKKNLGCDLSL